MIVARSRLLTLDWFLCWLPVSESRAREREREMLWRSFKSRAWMWSGGWGGGREGDRVIKEEKVVVGVGKRR